MYFEVPLPQPSVNVGSKILYDNLIGTLKAVKRVWYSSILLTVSVTRLGDFLHFGQPFKASGNNYFTQIALIVRRFL